MDNSICYHEFSLLYLKNQNNQKDKSVSKSKTKKNSTQKKNINRNKTKSNEEKFNFDGIINKPIKENEIVAILLKQ